MDQHDAEKVTSTRNRKLKPQSRQYFTFPITAEAGDVLLDCDLLSARSIGQRSETKLVDQFFLTDSDVAKPKPAKTVFRLRQDLGSGQCFADMRTYKKSTTKLRRAELELSALQALLLAPHDDARRPASWKVGKGKVPVPRFEARFSRTAFELPQGEKVTIDRAIRIRPLEFASTAGESHFAKSCLVTMKFGGAKIGDALPSSFKRLVYKFRLSPAPVSLIDLCIETAGRFPSVPSLLEQHVA